MKPRSVIAAEKIAAKRGVTAKQVMDELHAARGTYPGPDDLEPDEEEALQQQRRGGSLEAARRLGLSLVGMRVVYRTSHEVDAPGIVRECVGDRALVTLDTPTDDEGARWLERWIYVRLLRAAP